MNLNTFRNIQYVTSTLIFLIIFSFFFLTTKLHLTETQLSYWGADNDHGWLWNFSLTILSFSFYHNSKVYVDSFPDLNNKRTIKLLFLSTTLCLFLTSVFNVNYLWLHNIFAVGYFLLAPLSIFCLAHFNPKKIPVITWKMNIIMSSLTVVLPIIAIFFFNGLAVPEIIHTVLIMSWNFIILKKL